MKKKILSLSIVCILIITLIGLAGCGAEEANEVGEQASQNEMTNEVTEQPITKIDETKEIVYSVLDKDYEYFGKEIQVKIPAFNINTDEVKELNSKIEEEYQKVVESNDTFAATELTYEYYVNNDIISLVIKKVYLESSTNNYAVYNVNQKTGEVLDKEDILTAKNITKSEYEEKIAKQISAKFDENTAAFKEMGGYEELKEKNNSEENCSLENTEVYLENNGKLQYIANVYSMAGADKYQTIFDYE
jgi:hypothetical protein